MKTIAIVSGGLDSVTLAHHLHAKADRYGDLTLVSFDYGQRHSKELVFAHRAARHLGADYEVVPLAIGQFLTGSALTDAGVDVPHGHYAHESMRATVVPNRNAIMLMVATGIAVARGAACVATAVHAGDHAIYPDCRPEFIDALSAAARLGNDGFCDPDFRLEAPFAFFTKAQIAARSAEVGVRPSQTWSCYEGGEVHCGRCATCVERIEAFHQAGVEDDTHYADPDFWRSAVA